MSIVQPSPLLKKALMADAVVSGSAAVLQIAASTRLSDLLVFPQWLLFESGVFLVAYTVLLVVLARSARVAALHIRLVVAGNIGWAIGCVGLVVGNVVAPSGLGWAFLTAQVTAVLTFAGLEWTGLRASPSITVAGHVARRPS